MLTRRPVLLSNSACNSTKVASGWERNNPAKAGSSIRSLAPGPVAQPLHPPGTLPCRRSLPRPVRTDAEPLGQLAQAPLALVEGLKQLAPQIV